MDPVVKFSCIVRPKFSISAWIDFDVGSDLVLARSKRCVRPVAIRLQGVQPVFQDVIKFGQTIFHQTIETLQLLVCVGHLSSAVP